MSEKTIEQSRQHMLALATVADSEILLLMKGNKSAGGRARKSLQQLKTVCHELRKSIIEYLKTLPKKKSAPISGFKKKPNIEPVGVVETKVVENVKEPEPSVQEAKPKRVRKAVVKKVILSPEAEIIKQAKKV